MTDLSHKAIVSILLGLLLGAVICIVFLLWPTSLPDPGELPAGTLTVRAWPPDAKLTMTPPMNASALPAGTKLAQYSVNQPIEVSRFFNGDTRPQRIEFTISREGFAPQVCTFEGMQTFSLIPEEVNSQGASWPKEPIVLKGESPWSSLLITLGAKKVSAVALALILLIGIALFRRLVVMSRQADFLAACKASAGEDPYIGKTLGEYLIVDKIGQGGFGLVYRAIPESRAGQSQSDKYSVAIKIATNLDPKAVTRFYQELDAAKKTEHPNIVRIFEKGLTPGDDSPYLVMEYLSGTDLEDIISHPTDPNDKKSPREYLVFQPKRVIEYLEPVAKALQFAHDKGVVHRDLNPKNIKILEDGPTKILDFGLSKLDANRNRTLSRDFTAGTPAYIPKEQLISFSQVDARADQFSLGVICYHMLSGKFPFGEEFLEILTNLNIGKAFIPLLEAAPELSPEIAAVVEKMISHDPDQRFPTIGEAFSELKKAVG